MPEADGSDIAAERIAVLVAHWRRRKAEAVDEIELASIRGVLVGIRMAGGDDGKQSLR